jgi:Ca2+-binding EF-hand superfamily protein
VKKIIIALTLLSAPVLAQQQPMPQMPNLEELFFKQFDTDQDGQVSRQEFLKPTEAQFDHMDRNKDGVLDKSEVKAFNDEMKQRVQEMQRQMQQQGGAPQMPQR